MEYYSKRTSIIVLFLIVSLTTSITLIACAAETNNNNNNNNTLCIETEKQALLAFKNYIVEDPSQILCSWNDSSRDCCAWAYVVCDHLTGHVREIHLRSPNWDSRLRGMISPSLLNLKHLAYLDLSSNYFYGLEIPSFIGSMSSLEYLNLSYSQFQGNIPYNFSNLSSLRTLDLSNQFGEMENIQSLSGLVSLEYLGLDGVNLSRASRWLEVVNELPNLIELHLSHCRLDHFTPDLVRLNFTSLEVLDLSHNDFDSPVPSWIFNLSNLVSLDLRWNNLRGPIPSDKNMARLRYLDLSMNNFNCILPYWFLNSYGLEHVDLRNSGFYGAIPNAIGNLSSLRILDLSGNKFSGKIMWRIGNICNLQILDISSNEFEGNFSDVFGIRMSECFLASLLYLDASGNSLSGKLTEQVGEFQRLRYLNLAHNSFTGSIPLSLGKVSSLTILNLSDNKFVGNIPSSLGLLINLWDLDLHNNKLVGNIPFSFGQLSNLKELDLENNMLVGNIPSSFGQLSNLEGLSLNNNMLEGIVTENHFSNLSKLTYLTASENSPTLTVGEDWNPPFQLKYIDLGSWIVGSQFPSWVRTQRGLENISLANTGISGEIPTWFWSLPSLVSSNLSHNHLSGEIPHLIRISDVCLSSNNLSGPLPLISWLTRRLDLSNNSFSGGTARTLCIENKNQLAFLHLGRNGLSGEIPDCWMNWPSLEELNLGNNNFIGKFPASFRLLGSLRSLNLSWNYLSGSIPDNIGDMVSLESLDLSENNISGEIPIGLALLNYLNLSYNDLSGRIPTSMQLQRFNPSSFIGNKQLCGLPLSDKCDEYRNDSPPPEKNEEASEIDMWFYVCMSFGFIAGLWAWWLAVLFKESWIYAYFELLDEWWNRVCG